jgi:hypothetical protein
MKISAGTNKSKDEKDKAFSDPKTVASDGNKGKLKIPKSVTDNPQKHRYQRTVRPITNGHIVEHSWNDPDKGSYERHEVYSAEDPLQQEDGAGGTTGGFAKATPVK